ncbi:hypothetical protein [Allomuricauda sp. F6463D]|uniref:hypothetical protein n=1 Tax=Allomuricauda sp. F6463D TaxID=2926409 RepID=UPI001FF521E4|nr:hypothetical protein [Muricauda sp. F6463D]MCK0160127.1 hypothetical protein [Muricauda sp. F6463D]
MALLKKIKASTLMETLVATVLIVVVFMMASMTLNALFATSIQNNDGPARQELLFLQYRYGYGKLSLPYYDKLDAWDIKVEERVWQGTEQVIFSAVNTSNDRELKFSVNHE